MTEILRRNLSEEVYDILREMITSGELKPGQKLPEEKLTVRLQNTYSTCNICTRAR